MDDLTVIGNRIEAGCVSVFAYGFWAFRILRKPKSTDPTEHPSDHERG
jgi:hypothetical protein